MHCGARLGPSPPILRPIEHPRQQGRQEAQLNSAAISRDYLVAKVIRAIARQVFDRSADFLDGASPQPHQDELLQRRLPQLLAAMVQMQGDKIDTSETVGMFGSDSMARRGLTAQGKTPGANFALTSQRADEIAPRDTIAGQGNPAATKALNKA